MSLPINTPKQRLRVYKQVLKIYVDKTLNELQPSYGWAHGLCENLTWYVDDVIGKCSNVYEAVDYFKEFGEYHTGYGYSGAKKYEKLYESNAYKWRIKVLKEIINKIKNSNP